MNKEIIKYITLYVGNIRYLASTSNWIAVGSAIGSLNIIDIRTGQLMNHWKPADKWPFQVRNVTIHIFI